MQNNVIQDALFSKGMAIIYQPQDILFNIALAFILSLVISSVYKSTHKGLSYSQSFMLTIVFVTVIVSVVMMVIGNNLARAFALVGALSIIRFRTVVKDTKDTAYIFIGLTAGMAAGTSNYFLAVAATIIISVIAVALHATNYGSLYKSEFILRFRVKKGTEEKTYSDVMNRLSKTSSLLHVEPSADSNSSKLTFDIQMKKDQDPKKLGLEISELEGVSEVKLIASKTDIDY